MVSCMWCELIFFHVHIFQMCPNFDINRLIPGYTGTSSKIHILCKWEVFHTLNTFANNGRKLICDFETLQLYVAQYQHIL